jgi:hypothetical protein
VQRDTPLLANRASERAYPNAYCFGYAVCGFPVV